MVQDTEKTRSNFKRQLWPEHLRNNSMSCLPVVPSHVTEANLSSASSEKKKRDQDTGFAFVRLEVMPEIIAKVACHCKMGELTYNFSL